MKWRKYLIPLIFVISYYSPIFLHLDSQVLRIYDEARRGVNALEMLQNGNWLVTHFGGKPDMWGTKPPLLIWLQAISMKIVGYNELAVRLPSALAAVGTVVLLIYFSSKFFSKPIIGFIAGLVLLTTPGYLAGTHSIRTGDFDSLLTFFTTAYLLTFFLFLNAQNKREKTKSFYLTCLFITLGVLTKSVAALFFIPGILIYSIFTKKGLEILRSKHTYIGILFFLFFVLGFYLLREHYNPGYLQAIWKNELGGRYSTSLEAHEQPFFYYFKNLYKSRYTYWVWFIPLGVIVSFLKKGNTRKLGFYLIFNILAYLLIISKSHTKLSWYDIQVFPALALIVAIGVYELYHYIAKKFNGTDQSLRSIFILIPFLVLLFVFPYQTVLGKIYWKRYGDQQTQYGYFLKKFKDLDYYNITHLNYNPHVLFYTKAERAKGKVVYTINPHSQRSIGTKIVVCEPKAYKLIQKKHEIDVILQWEKCRLVKVKGHKTIESGNDENSK